MLERSPTSTPAALGAPSSASSARARERACKNTSWPSAISNRAAINPRPSAEPVMKTRLIAWSVSRVAAPSIPSAPQLMRTQHRCRRGGEDTKEGTSSPGGAWLGAGHRLLGPARGMRTGADGDRDRVAPQRRGDGDREPTITGGGGVEDRGAVGGGARLGGGDRHLRPSDGASADHGGAGHGSAAGGRGDGDGPHVRRASGDVTVARDRGLVDELAG